MVIKIIAVADIPDEQKNFTAHGTSPRPQPLSLIDSRRKYLYQNVQEVLVNASALGLRQGQWVDE